MELFLNISILIVLVFFSGFFSGVETALFSLSSLRVKHLVKKGIHGAAAVDKLKQNPQRLLTTILIGNNVVNVAASVVATAIALELFANNALAYATGFMTLFLLIFGEITPKTLATRYNKQIALFVAPVLLFLEILLFPIIIIFEKFTNFLLWLLGSKKEPLITEEELKSFAHVAADIGQIQQDEKQLLMRVFNLNDLFVKDIMTPLNETIGVLETVSIKKVHPIFAKKRHQRIILFDNHKNIQGFIHSFDVTHENDNSAEPVSTLKREILFLEQSLPLDKALRILQGKKMAIAAVVDAKGKHIGIITLHDILEELVGHLVDQVEPKK